MRLAEKQIPKDNTGAISSTVDKKEKQPYSGKDKRPFNRYPYSPESEAMIRDIKRIMCSTNNCSFSLEEQQTVKHLTGMYGDTGSKDSSAGIEIHRNTMRFVNTVILYLSDAKKYAWRALIIGSLSFTGYAIWDAFIREVRG